MFAPLAFRLVELPITIVSPQQAKRPGFSTLTVAVPIPVQPFVTATEYTATVSGLTVIESVVAPLFQRYVPTPVAVSVTVSLLQISVFPVMLTTGVGFTVTITAVSLLHPF